MLGHILTTIGVGITVVVITVAGVIGFVPQAQLTKLQMDVASQMTEYENKMNELEERLGATIPIAPALFETTLASKISSSATSMTLTSGTDKSGDNLSGYICFTIDEGTASEEFVCGTTSGTAVTSMIRGIDPVDGDLEVTALKKEHRRGASVKVTNYPQLGILSRILNGDETLPNILTYDTENSFTSNAQIIDKKYADDLAISGAPDGTETVKGIFELSTLTELNASTLSTDSTGGTGANLIVGINRFSSASTANTTVPVTGTDGKLDQAFFDLTEDFSFSGHVAMTSTASMSGAVTMSGGATISGTLIADSATTGILTADTPTFNGFAILPSQAPYDDAHATNKEYVDDAITTRLTDGFGDMIEVTHAIGTESTAASAGFVFGYVNMTSSSTIVVNICGVSVQAVTNSTNGLKGSFMVPVPSGCTWKVEYGSGSAGAYSWWMPFE